MTGWIFTYNGVAVSWASKKQGLVTQSTMELELVAISFTSAEGIWLIHMGKDFRQDFSPITIFTNNQSFFAFSTNNVNNNRTKHIDTHYHYTRDQISNGNIKLHYICSQLNPTNILTKLLSPRKHMYTHSGSTQNLAGLKGYVITITFYCSPSHCPSQHHYQFHSACVHHTCDPPKIQNHTNHLDHTIAYGS